MNHYTYIGAFADYISNTQALGIPLKAAKTLHLPKNHCITYWVSDFRACIKAAGELIASRAILRPALK